MRPQFEDSEVFFDELKLSFLFLSSFFPFLVIFQWVLVHKL